MKDADRLITAAMNAAREATDVIVKCTAASDNQIRFSNGQIDISNQWSFTKMDVFVAIGKRIGSTEIQGPTSQVVRARISELVARTKGMGQSQLYNGISGAPSKHRRARGLLDRGIEGFGEQAPILVRQVIDAAEEQGARRVAGSLSFGRRRFELGTNHGVRECYDESSYDLNVRSFVDSESSGQGLASGRDMSKAEERFLEAARESGRIAAMSKGGVQGRPGRYDLLMNPTVAANLLGQLAESANPLLMMLGASPLKGRLGAQLGPEGLSVVDDPDMAEGLGSRPFDDEGVPTRVVDLFRRGRFVGVLHSTSTAREAGTQTTGSSRLVNMGGSRLPAPWASNLAFKAGDSSPQEMLEDCKKPTIYVTSTWYTRFSNYEEGIFSTIPRDGIFLVENGEIAKPLRKIRISDNIVGLLSRIQQIGSDVTQVRWWEEVETPTFIPHVKFSDVNITTATM